MIDRTPEHVHGLMRDAERVERRLRALESREAIAPAVMVQRVTSVEAQLATILKRVGTIAQSERDGLLKAVGAFVCEKLAEQRPIERQLLEALEACSARITALEAKPVLLPNCELGSAQGGQNRESAKKAPARKARAKRRAPRTSRPESTKPRKRAA